MGGMFFRECVGLQLGMLDFVYEKSYYNETRDGDSDNDPGKGTSIREWAMWVAERRCKRSIALLTKAHHTYECFPWLEIVAELDGGGRVPTTQWALSHEVELECGQDTYQLVCLSSTIPATYLAVAAAVVREREDGEICVV